jgi:dolichol kinase
VRFSLGLRRLLHAASTGLLLLMPLGGLALLRWTLIGIVVLAAGLEAVRLSRAGLHTLLARAIPVFRASEAHRPSGATWLAVGYALSVWLPPPGPQAGLLVGGLADPAASLAGSRWGRRAGASGEAERKTLVGTLAFAAVAAAALLAAGLDPAAVALTAAAAAVVERFAGAVDDNLVVPVVAAVVAFLVS